MSKMLQDISVNGKIQAVEAHTIRELLVAQGIDPQRRGIAIAVNGEVVPRTAWEQTAIQPGDRVEIVHALAGG